MAAIYSVPLMDVPLVASSTTAPEFSHAQAQACEHEREKHRRCFGAAVQQTFSNYSKDQHMQHVLKLIQALRRISDSPQQHCDAELCGYCIELEVHLSATTDKRFFDPGCEAEKELASVLLVLLMSPLVGPHALPSVCSLIRCDQVVIKNCGVTLDWRKVFYRLTIICGQDLKTDKTALSQVKRSSTQGTDFVRAIGKICRLFPAEAYAELAQVLVDRHALRFHQWLLYYALQSCPIGSFDWRPFVKFLAETPPYNPNGTFIIARILKRNCSCAAPLLPSDSLVSTLFNFVFFSLDSIGPSGSESSGVVTSSSSELWTELEIVVHLCALCPDQAIPKTLQLFERLELFVHPNSGTRDEHIDALLLRFADHILLNTTLLVRKSRNPSKHFLPPHHYHALVTPLVRIIFNALLHENSSVRLLAISSIKSVLDMGSPSCVLDMIDDKVRAVFSDIGLTASHHTPMVIQLATNILPCILSATHPSYPFKIPPQHSSLEVIAAAHKFCEVHGYDTQAAALHAHRLAIFTASDPEASFVAQRRAKGLLLLPFLLSQLLEQLFASDLSVANAVLEFYEAFCLMVPLFPLPADAIRCADISDEVWSAIVSVSHSLQEWACSAFDKLLYMADHMLDSEDTSSATADSKKVGATMIALINALPEKSWSTKCEYELTRQSAHAKLIHILKTSMNWKHARSRMLLIRVIFNTNPELPAVSSLVHNLVDRVVIRNGIGTPSAESEDFFSIVGLPEGVKFVSLSPEELAYNVWLLWQCLASCRCTSIFSDKLKGERLMDKIVLAVHCMLLLHNENLASLPNFRDFALHRDLFTHSLHLMKATMEAQCSLFHTGTSSEYFMVPSSMWHDPLWHRFSYISWGRGVSTAHIGMQTSVFEEMPRDLHESISMNLMAPLEILAANSSELSDKILEKYMMMARQTLCVVMPHWHILAHNQRVEYSMKPEFQVVEAPAWQATVRALRHEYCHINPQVPVPNPFPDIGSVAALFTEVVEKMSQRALKDNSVTIASSVLSLAQYWCNDITLYSSAGNLLHDTIYENERWIRKKFLTTMESISSSLMKTATHTRCTVFEYAIAKAVLPLLFHSIQSVRNSAIATLGKIMAAHPRLIVRYLYTLVMPIATDLSCSEHAFAGCILFFENVSVQKLYIDDDVKRLETVTMIILNQERVIEDPLILNQFLHFAAFTFIEAIPPCYPHALWAAAANGDSAASAALNNRIDPTDALQRVIGAYANKELHWKLKECGYRLFEVLRLSGHHLNFSVFELLLKEACCLQLGAKMFITEIQASSLGVHSLVTQSINGVLQLVRESIRIAWNGGFEPFIMAKRIGYHDRDFAPVSTASAADVDALKQQRAATRRAFIGDSTPEFLSLDERNIIDSLRKFLLNSDDFATFAETRYLNCTSNADQASADLQQFQNSQELEAHVADEYITFFSLLTSIFGRAVLLAARPHIEEAFQLLAEADTPECHEGPSQRDLLPDSLPEIVFGIEAFTGIIAGSKHLPKDEVDFISQGLEPLLQTYLEGVSGADQEDFEWMQALQALSESSHPGGLEWVFEAILKPILQCNSENMTNACSTHVLIRRLKFAYSLAASSHHGISAPLEQFVSVAHVYACHSSSLVRERVSKLVGTLMCNRLVLARSIHDINRGYDGAVICSSTWRRFVDYLEQISQRLSVIEDSISAKRHVKTGAQSPNEADPIEHSVVILVSELHPFAMGQVVGFAAPALLSLLFRLSAIRDQDYAEVLYCFVLCDIFCLDIVTLVFRSWSCRPLLKSPGSAICLFFHLKLQLKP